MIPESGHSVVLDPIPGVSSDIVLATHDPDLDLVSRKLHETRAWESFESRLWLAAHSPDCVVLDVGANLGYYSLLSALGDVPASRVFAFEPAADNYHLLTENLRANGCADRVEAMELALGERDGQIALHRSADNRGDHQVYEGDGVREEEPISILNGANFLRSHTSRVDLVKLDTQGSELAVLKGLLPVLESNREHLRMLIELTPFSLQLAGASGRELINLLDQLGLPLYIVDHVSHELVPSDAAALALWCDNVAATAGDRGFMNIFAGSAPVL